MAGSGGEGGGGGRALAILAVVLAVPGTLVSLNELNVVDLFPHVITADEPKLPGGTDAPCGIAAPAEITLSAGKAARGSHVTVFGSCFNRGERVEIRVHATVVGSATADDKGGFEQSITVPASAPPPGFPTSVAASGQSSVKTATAPFESSA